MFEPAEVDLDRIEILRIRPKPYNSAGIAFGNGIDRLEFAGLLAVGEVHMKFLPVAPDPDLKLLGQRVDYRNSHTMKPPRKAIVFIGELSTGMQSGQDHLHAADTFILVFVDRHTASIVRDSYRVIFMQYDLDSVRVTCDGLVDTVVDHFLYQMIGSFGLGIHTRTFAHRFKSRQDLDCG